MAAYDTHAINDGRAQYILKEWKEDSGAADQEDTCHWCTESGVLMPRVLSI